MAGPVDARETIDVQVHFQLRNPAQADAELAAVSDPDSPQYGHFLSDEEYAAKYGPTDADVAALRAHLESQGLRITHIPTNRTFISATGSAAQVGRAFSTTLAHYKVGSELRRAPQGEPKLPDHLAPRVLGVLGLSTPAKMKPRDVRVGGIRRDSITPPNGTKAVNSQGMECSEWFGATPDLYDPPYSPAYPPLTYAPCGYKPAQLRQAYGFDKAIRKGNDGTGQAIALVDAYLSPTLLSDAQTYAAQNDPDYPLDSSQLTTVWAPGTPTAAMPDWYTEQTLDVEAVHAIAPGAKIVAVAAQSQSDQDLVAAVNMVIAQKLANLVSNSYETQEEASLTNVLIWKSLATQAGLKGVGLYFSSGDSGDEAFSFPGYSFPPTLSFPGSLPTVTSVGGTSLAMGATGQRLWETGWETGLSYLEYIPPPVDGGPGGNDGGPGLPDASTGPITDAGTAAPSARPTETADSGAPQAYGYTWYPAAPGQFYFGGGGGISILFEQPSYQAGIVPDSLANAPGVPARVVPDVSMVGDPVTGMVIGQTSPYFQQYQEFTIGGTSLSSPLFAGVMALAQQHAKRSFGFANALLYKASKKGAFNDVLPLATPQAVVPGYGVVATFDYEGQSIHVTPGYDDVTGLGAPNGASFLSAVK